MIHPQACEHMHTHACTHTPAHAHKQACAHTHTHTHIHNCTYSHSACTADSVCMLSFYALLYCWHTRIKSSLQPIRREHVHWRNPSNQSGGSICIEEIHPTNQEGACALERSIYPHTLHRVTFQPLKINGSMDLV